MLSFGTHICSSDRFCGFDVAGAADGEAIGKGHGVVHQAQLRLGLRLQLGHDRN